MQNDEQINTTDPTAPMAPVNPGLIKGKNVSEIKIYEIILMFVGLLQISIACFAFHIFPDWKNSVWYIPLVALGVFYCIKVINKRSQSLQYTAFACFGIFAILTLLSVLLLFSYTGGNEYTICSRLFDCEIFTFVKGVKEIVKTIFIFSIFILILCVFFQRKEKAKNTDPGSDDRGTVDPEGKLIKQNKINVSDLAIEKWSSLNVKIYEIFLVIIGVVCIPILVYVAVISNAWITFFVWLPLISIIGWIFDFFYVKVITKICYSIPLVLAFSYSIFICLEEIAVALLFFKTKGGSFLSCADTCSEATFDQGVDTIGRFIFASLLPGIVLFSIILWNKKMKRQKNKSLDAERNSQNAK